MRLPTATLIAATLVAATVPAFAQSAPPADPAMLQAAIGAVQAQRNQALDQAAGLSAQLQLVSKELADLKAADKAAADAAKPKADAPKADAPK